MQQMIRKTADALYIPLPLPGGLCFSFARPGSQGGSVSDWIGLRTAGGSNAQQAIRSGAWARGLLGGLGAIAMALALSATGAQEAKAQNGTGAIIHINNQFANFTIGPNNGGQTGNGGLFGINNQFFNDAIGANNQPKTARGYSA